MARNLRGVRFLSSSTRLSSFSLMEDSAYGQWREKQGDWSSALDACLKMGQTIHWGLASPQIQHELRWLPWADTQHLDFCRTAKVFDLCINPYLTQVQSLSSQRFCSVSAVTWHVAATSARCLMNTIWGSLEVSFEGLNSSFLFLTVFLKPELCYLKYLMVMISPFLQRLLTWPLSLRVLFLERKQQYWGVSGWLMAPITQLCQEPSKSRWGTTSTRPVYGGKFILEQTQWKSALSSLKGGTCS